MDKTFFATSEIAKALGISRRQVEGWAGMGILSPVRVGGSNRAAYGFDERDVLAAALARELRRRGFGLPQAVAVADWVRNHELAALARDWAEGRRLLFVVGDNDPYPRLLRREDIFNNEEIQLERAMALGVPVAVIDVEQAYRQLRAKLREPAAERAAV